MTSNFREKPFETIRSHICLLLEILGNADFDSFVYLSSTRVYSRATGSHEDTVLGAAPTDPEDLYNLSKMMGESICLSPILNNVKIIRLSNVYGSDFKSNNFIFSIIRDAVNSKKIDCIVEVEPNSKQVTFPRIDINRVQKEFGLSPSSLFSNLSSLILRYLEEKAHD